MKTFPVGLDTLLDTGQFVQADLYTITLITGTILRYTTAEVDVTDGSSTWTSKNVYFDRFDQRSLAEWKTGMDVSQWVVHVMPLESDPATGTLYPGKIGSTPWLQAVRIGALDGAQMKVDRAYWAYWPKIDFTGTLPAWATITNAAKAITAQYVLANVFLGRVATVDLARNQAVITANDYKELFSTAVPIQVFQAGCRHTLFDAGCTLTQATFGKNCTASAGSTNNIVLASVPSAPSGSGTFNLGQLRFTSGDNSGLRYGIRSWVNGGGGTSTFTLIRPPAYTVNAGDTFTAYPGCDKQVATCTLFGNAVNFGGQPFIPSPETVVDGAQAGPVLNTALSRRTVDQSGVTAGGDGR